ncbi:Hypothetical protein EAG7_02530 [Klebsiella aerogenes]|nr:Hypothetical protein EAG7_02530 [Klebsiella aerogenes]PVF73864.1 hypothetical protein CSC18_3516 [Klebsiella aerogenes]CCG31006.1 hypothetical protein [Klebsiella aerogenes EA1509E]
MLPVSAYDGNKPLTILKGNDKVKQHCLNYQFVTKYTREMPLPVFRHSKYIGCNLIET